MSELDKEAKRILDDAMKQPGVAEVLDVFAAQQPAIDALNRAQQAVAPRWLFSTTTSSQPAK